MPRKEKKKKLWENAASIFSYFFPHLYICQHSRSCGCGHSISISSFHKRWMPKQRLGAYLDLWQREVLWLLYQQNPEEELYSCTEHKPSGRKASFHFLSTLISFLRNGSQRVLFDTDTSLLALSKSCLSLLFDGKALFNKLHPRMQLKLNNPFHIS